MTFSIVAFDPETADLGVAVQSKFLAVGSAVPFAKAGVGAIATQSWMNTSYGPRGLRMLGLGMTPRQVSAKLVASDNDAGQRQFGIVDAKGRSHSFTGGRCCEWAGGTTGRNYAAQGNILAGARVVEEIARAFEEAEGSLGERLVAALQAGQRAGGDRRGQESAALLVVREKGGYGGFNDRYIDLRVDDHPRPIDELGRLLGLHHLYFGRPRREDRIAIDSLVALELQKMMNKQGCGIPLSGEWDTRTAEAFREFAGFENLEERLHDGAFIDRTALGYLRKKYKGK